MQHLFFLFAFLLVGSALAAVGFRNPVYAIFSLMLAFIAAAALFLLLQAEFLAMVTVVVYVGAVITLFLFVVMMLNISKTSFAPRSWTVLPLALALAAALMVSLGGVVSQWQQAGRIGAEALSITSLGGVLYTRYLLLFQMSGIIFIAAMVAPILLNLRRRRAKRQSPTAQLRKKNVRLVKVKIGQGI